MPLHFPAELPVDCIRELVTAVRNGDYVSSETVDHAVYALGCLNALRGPSAFGAGLEDELASCPCPEPEEATDEDLAGALEQAAAPQANGDGVTAVGAIPPWVFPIVLEIIRRIIERRRQG